MWCNRDGAGGETNSRQGQLGCIVHSAEEERHKSKRRGGAAATNLIGDRRSRRGSEQRAARQKGCRAAGAGGVGQGAGGTGHGATRPAEAASIKQHETNKSREQEHCRRRAAEGGVANS